MYKLLMLLSAIVLIAIGTFSLLLTLGQIAEYVSLTGAVSSQMVFRLVLGLGLSGFVGFVVLWAHVIRIEDKLK